MRWWRQTLLSRAVVLAILLWTAVDLSNASLCALENESGGSRYGAGLLTPQSAALLEDGSTSSVPPAPAPHIDDCFCCSHCVEFAGLAPGHPATIIEGQKAPVVLAAVRIFGAPLYHPPQVSLL